MSRGTPAKLDGLAQQIEILRASTAEILRSTDLAELKRHGDAASALKAVAKRMGASAEFQNEAAEQALRVRRRLGELTACLEKSQGKRTDRQLPVTMTGSSKADLLASAGIDENAARRAEVIAIIPEDQFQAIIDRIKDSGEELTSGPFIEIGQKIKADRRAGADKWKPALDQLRMLFRSFDEAGGIQSLMEYWNAEQRQFLREVLDECIEDLQRYRQEAEENQA